MGNNEENVSEDSVEGNQAANEETKENVTEDTKEENKTNDSPNESKPEAKPEIKESEEEKKPEEIRKVIKVDEREKAAPEKKEGATDEVLDGNDKGSLEQKRAILQSIKDFDFQIKKNQEEINGLNSKLDSVSKDLDDLVSLYEIVSEQMNPFVGLSKVTKKRIDALENFTKEVEDLKTRMGDLESFAEMAGANLDEIRSRRPETPTIDNNNVQEAASTEKLDSTPKSTPASKDEISNKEADRIIERAFNSISADSEIDNLIDEFIENLKDVNIN